MRRGQIFWWNCPEHNRQYVQAGGRPVLIVSNNRCNLNSDVITVAPMTQAVKAPYPNRVLVAFKDKVSTILLDQVTSIPVSELGSYMGYLYSWQMKQVDKAIANQFGLDGDDAE